MFQRFHGEVTKFGTVHYTHALQNETERATYGRDDSSAIWRIFQKRCIPSRTTTTPYISTRSLNLPRSWKYQTCHLIHTTGMSRKRYKIETMRFIDLYDLLIYSYVTETF